MNKSTEDRRVRKTKKALREGLAELMMDKDLRSITVRELTNRVDIHRATFYTHYKDIYDLYEQIENEVIHELQAIFSDITPGTYGAMFETLISYIYDNRKLGRMFLSRKGNSNFLERISTMIEELWVADSGLTSPDEEWMFLASYHIQGCLAIISRWANQNFIYPKDEIANLIRKMDNECVF